MTSAGINIGMITKLVSMLVIEHIGITKVKLVHIELQAINRIVQPGTDIGLRGRILIPIFQTSHSLDSRSRP